MLQSLKSVDTAFRQVKLFAFLFMLLCISVVMMLTYHYNQLENKLLSRLDKPYLLAGKNVYDIQMVKDLSETRPIEAIGHIERFHELYFNLDPDEKLINENMSKAMYLVDESGIFQYEHQKNKNYFRQLISENISQRISLTKPIELDTIGNRVKFRLEAHQYLTRSTSIVKRLLITEGFLRDQVARTENNRYGFIVEGWNIVENIDVEVVKK